MKNKFLSMAIISVASFVALTSCSKDNSSNNSKASTGEYSITFENVVKPKKYVESGILKGNGEVTTSDGSKIGGLILPSDDSKTNSASVTFAAGKGQRLMFTMMFGASKDWFFAAKQPGIELYDKDGKPRTGDIASDISLWDNGTKNDETGIAESAVITSLFTKKMPQKLMKLNLTYDEKTSNFTLTIKNTSKGQKDTEGKSLETPFAPVVWAVSNVLGGKLLDEKPFFTAGEKSYSELTTLSETGNPEPLYNKVKAETGIITGLSPAIVVVYDGNVNPIYELGKKDAGLGLKELSQMGDFKKLQTELKKIAGVKEIYVAGNAPVAPSSNVTTKFKAEKGNKIAYAFMFGYSNDWFYANEGAISATEKANLTSKTILLDNGTGVDQFPGAGNKQALFGGKSDVESKAISKVGTTFPVPAVSDVIKVTIQ